MFFENNKKYNLIKFQAAADALVFITKHINKIDLLLLDLMMPEVDGFTTLRYIRQNPMLKHLPVIIQTGCEDESELKRAKNLGANSFLYKPFKKECLFKAIDTIIFEEISST